MRPYYEDMSGRLSSIHNDWPLSFLFFCVSHHTNGSTSNHFVLCAHMYFIESEMWYKTNAICIQITEFQDFCEFASHCGIVFSFDGFYKLQCSWCYFEHMLILLFSSVSNLCSSQWWEWHEQTGALLKHNRQNESEVQNWQLRRKCIVSLCDYYIFLF